MNRNRWKKNNTLFHKMVHVDNKKNSIIQC